MGLMRKFAIAAAAASLTVAPTMAVAQPIDEDAATEGAFVVGGVLLIAAGIIIAGWIDDDNDDDAAAPVSP